MLPHSTTPFTVYQLFDRDGSLLYVGATSHWPRRARQHRRECAWFDEVTDTRTAVYATPNEAAAEERRLIATARPRYNKLPGNYIFAKDHQPEAETDDATDHLGAHVGIGRGTEVEAAPEEATGGLNSREAAKRAHVSERTIRAWVANGDVTHYFDERGVRRIPAASLDAHIQRRGIAIAAMALPPEAPPAPVPGLAELAATLEEQRKELRDLRWQNGYLTAQLESTKQENARLVEEREQQKLLTAGPEADPEVAAEPEAIDEDDPPWWSRLRRWWERGGY